MITKFALLVCIFVSLQLISSQNNDYVVWNIQGLPQASGIGFIETEQDQFIVQIPSASAGDQPGNKYNVYKVDLVTEKASLNQTVQLKDTDYLASCSDIYYDEQNYFMFFVSSQTNQVYMQDTWKWGNTFTIDFFSPGQVDIQCQQVIFDQWAQKLYIAYIYGTQQQYFIQTITYTTDRQVPEPLKSGIGAPFNGINYLHYLPKVGQIVLQNSDLITKINSTNLESIQQYQYKSETPTQPQVQTMFISNETLYGVRLQRISQADFSYEIVVFDPDFNDICSVGKTNNETIYNLEPVEAEMFVAQQENHIVLYDLNDLTGQKCSGDTQLLTFNQAYSQDEVTKMHRNVDIQIDRSRLIIIHSNQFVVWDYKLNETFLLNNTQLNNQSSPITGWTNLILPSSIILSRQDGVLQLLDCDTFDDNQNNNGGHTHWAVIIICGIILPLIVIAAVVYAFFIWRKKRREQQAGGNQEEKLLSSIDYKLQEEVNESNSKMKKLQGEHNFDVEIDNRKL